MAPTPKPISGRFWQYVYKTPGCWFWIGSQYPSGYGSFAFGTGRQNVVTKRAHRVAWFLVYGHWPKELMHTCDTRQCVHPQHLKECTHRENHLDQSSKGINPNLWKMTAETCKRGHPKTEENIYVAAAGFKACRPCRAMLNRKYRRAAR